MAMPTLPRLPRDLPTSADLFPNGDPPAHLLRDPGDGRGSLLVPPSYGMQALHLYARAAGWQMKTTGRGRTLVGQTSLFLARYTPTYDSNVNTTADSRVVKLDQRTVHPYLVPGHRWYKRKGVAAAASPGTSNHGWWCADDIALELDGDPDAEGVSEAFTRWLVPIAHLFGWTWELQSEPWHLSWISGDSIPPFACSILSHHHIPHPGGTVVADRFEFTQRRLYDSRDVNTKIVGQKVLPVFNLPDSVLGLALNVTVTETEADGFVAVWDKGDHPGTSLQNWKGAGVTIANSTEVALGPNDTFIVLVGGGAAHVIIDIIGYWLTDIG